MVGAPVVVMHQMVLLGAPYKQVLYSPEQNLLTASVLYP